MMTVFPAGGGDLAGSGIFSVGVGPIVGVPRNIAVGVGDAVVPIIGDGVAVNNGVAGAGLVGGAG